VNDAATTADGEGISLAPGTSFGRYTILRRLGAGGMATVYEARHVDLHKRVALKLLHPWHALRVEVVQRFFLEARTASRIAHPNVVGISDIGAVDGTIFLAMDLLEGEELIQLLGREGPLPIERVADIMLPVLSAVAAAHDAGILHRDLKPANVFLARRRPHGEHPVLLDFGISKVDGGGPATPLTAAGEVLGTPAYMSPEQVVQGMASFDERSDQYALGVTLYEIATGALPFSDEQGLHPLFVAISQGNAPPPSSRRSGLPRAFEELVARAMSLDPEERFPSVLDLSRALLPFASERTKVLFGAEVEKLATPTAPPPPLLLRPSDLVALPIFSGLAERDAAALLEIAPPAHVTSGAAIVDQGARASSCVVIVSGEVEIFRTHGADTWEIDVVGSGAVLGLLALWDDAPRPVSAIAKTDCVIVEIRRAALPRLVEACPRALDRLQEALGAGVARRLKSGGDRLTQLLSRPGRAPSREALARLVSAVGELALTMPGEG
jgi:CRP-like cAMP-binding protein/tRNA A-37 threonylcarbamoyl transferase component Bud32